MKAYRLRPLCAIDFWLHGFRWNSSGLLQRQLEDRIVIITNLWYENGKRLVDMKVVR